jgi:hypothetical protein
MKSLDPWDFIMVTPSGDVFYPGDVYQHPFYQEVPSWIHYGASNDTTRQLFDGAFIGADYAGADMTNSGGITFKKELDDRQVLHVEICVDGKCYRTATDLAPAISMVLDKLARWHLERHGQADPKLLAPAVVGAVEATVGEAGDAMIAALVTQHQIAVGDFFGDIGNDLSSAANAVGSVLKDLKGPISVAAGAAATYYGGSAAGPVAAQLAGSLVDASPGGSHPARRAAAQQTIAVAKQAARTNPTVQVALDAANHATSQTTTAALGHPAVPQASGTLGSAVQKLLPVAVKAFSSQGGGGGGGGGSNGSGLSSDLQGALSTFGSMLSDGGGDAAVSGVPVIVGSFWDDVGNAILTVTGTKMTNQFIHDHHLEGVVGLAGQAVATYYGGPAGGMAAKALGPTIMSLGVEDKKKATAAKKTVAAAKTAAQQVGPQAAQAVDAAHAAINHTAAAFHTAQVVSDAKAGVPQAQAAISNLQTSAANGDPNAAKALQAVDAIDQAQQAAPPAPPAPDGTAVVGCHEMIGVVIGAPTYYAPRVVARTTARPTTISVRPGAPARPVVVTRPPVTPAHGVSIVRTTPPASYQRHGDYNFVEGWGWWPNWFPYWDSSWFSYWSSLYDYYGGDGNPDYAEYMRDKVMRQMAVQQGWLSGDFVSGNGDVQHEGTTAHHVEHLLKKAQQGDANAKQALSKIRDRAAAGDQHALKAIEAAVARRHQQPQQQRPPHHHHHHHHHQQQQPPQAQMLPQQSPPQWQQQQPSQQAQPVASGWYDLTGTAIGACPCEH